MPTESGNIPESTGGGSGPELIRQLGLWDSAAIIVGIIIGSGIFLTPALVARQVQDPGLILVVWVFGGFLSLLGALIFAELASFMPATGGIYVFLKDAFGPIASFTFGWLYLTAIKPVAEAAIATGVATYLQKLIPIGPTGVKVAAILIIIGISSIHYRGVRLGSGVQNVLTALKVLLIGGFILFGLFHARADWSVFSTSFTAPFDLGVLSSMGAALALVLWAYDGWADISYIAGEVKDPGRSLPKAIILGTVGVIVIYLAINVVYLVTVPMQQLLVTQQVASDSARTLLGASGATLVTIAILISITGSANGSIMVGPRVFYQMGKEGYFFRWAGKVHPRFHTPANAVVIQAVWGSILVAAFDFEKLSNLFVFSTWLFFMLSTVALFIFRGKYPDRERPYRTWGYPVTPVVFLLIAGTMLINTVVQFPLESGLGLGFAVLAIPVYYIFFRRSLGKPGMKGS